MSKIEEARNVKADGNRYFKAGDYTTAIERYETGLSLAEDDLVNVVVLNHINFV